jgi:hypothetical protein
MLARQLALLAVACIGMANGRAVLPSARAAAQSVNGGRVNAGRITQITGDGLVIAVRDGGLQPVEFEDIWRVRQAYAIDEPEGTVVIDYAGSRLYVESRLSDVIVAVRGKVPLTKFTAPNGQAIYLSAAKVTNVSNSLPALHNALSKTVIGMSAGSQQVQESAAAARRIVAEARAKQRASLGEGVERS